MSWSEDLGRRNIPVVCVEELAGPAAVWGESDEATTVALLIEMGSELAATPMAVATGSEDGEEARLTEEGKAPSLSPGMPALAAIAKLAVTNICKTRMAKNRMGSLTRQSQGRGGESEKSWLESHE
ncbi:hypothetical protein HC256_008230 [Beauveria bassiana]|nr:hypothetical protein HC256_008230 [Beauveria bassiana]